MIQMYGKPQELKTHISSSESLTWTVSKPAKTKSINSRTQSTPKDPRIRNCKLPPKSHQNRLNKEEKSFPEKD
jgi:hypothetical protein